MEAWDACHSAQQIAQQIGDHAVYLDAISVSGDLYQLDGRDDDALRLYRQAARIAEQNRWPWQQYQSEWRAARLLARRGGASGPDRDATLAAYREAAQTFRAIRADASLGFDNDWPEPVTAGANPPATASPGRISPFRNRAGALFVEFADQLLRRSSDPQRQASQARQDLIEARDAMEDLKAAELEDYFRSDCATLTRSRLEDLDDSIAAHTVVVYVIALPDRTELLLSLSDRRLLRITSNVTYPQMSQAIGSLRFNLEDRTTHAYKTAATALYNWLIAPIQPLLQSEKIDTIVFVPDAGLRTIPLAALWNETTGRFLVEDYAVAISPGLTLTAPAVAHSGQPGRCECFARLPVTRSARRAILRRMIPDQPAPRGQPSRSFSQALRSIQSAVFIRARPWPMNSSSKPTCSGNWTRGSIQSCTSQATPGLMPMQARVFSSAVMCGIRSRYSRFAR